VDNLYFDKETQPIHMWKDCAQFSTSYSHYPISLILHECPGAVFEVLNQWKAASRFSHEHG
jgi:hypothetical protein